MKNPIKEYRERKKKEEEKHRKLLHEYWKTIHEGNIKYQDLIREINEERREQERVLAERHHNTQQAILDMLPLIKEIHSIITKESIREDHP